MTQPSKPKRYRIRPGFDDVLLDELGRTLWWSDTENPHGLPAELRDLIDRIAILYGQYLPMTMFEETTYQGGPVIVAQPRPVPPQAKQEMKRLIDAAIACIAEMSPETPVTVDVDELFID